MNIAEALWRGSVTPEEAEEQLRRNSIAPETLSIETNMVCPLRCQYCYLNDRPPTKVADLDRVADTLEQAADLGVRRFAFVGKEPLADDRSVTLIRRLDRRTDRARLQIGMVTNGVFGARQVANLAPLRLDYLDVSVDGLSWQNDPWRGTGSFEKALKAIMLFRALPQAALVVNSVLHRRNMHDLQRFMDTLQESGVRHFSFAPVLDLTGAESTARLCAEPEQLFGPVWCALVDYASANPECQVMLDLSMAWTMLAIQSGAILLSAIQRDGNGVYYARPRDAAQFFVKLQLLPQDTWHWARLTHDGYFLGRLRAAASPDYVRMSSGNIRHRTFGALFSESLQQPGWLADEWEQALSWASRRAVEPRSPLTVLV